MTRVAILPEKLQGGEIAYRAISGNRQSIGKTAGQALDALTAVLPAEQTGTLVIVQNLRPDAFFTAEQQGRLRVLMDRWRAARDADEHLAADEQAELDALVDAEVRATAARTSALLDELRQ